MPAFNGYMTGDEVIAAFPDQIEGRTFVITGTGEPSIDSQMATMLARGSPTHIAVVSRTASRVEPALARIAAEAAAAGRAAPKTTLVQADLTDHASVRAAAVQILEAAPRIDLLVNCAGVMALKEYSVDRQRIKLQLSANHVGHFLLTNLLAPALLAAARASNTGMELQFEEPRFKTFDQIAAAPLVAALDPGMPAKSPAYVMNGEVSLAHCAEHARDPEAVKKLWKLSEELVKRKFSHKTAGIARADAMSETCRDDKAQLMTASVVACSDPGPTAASV
ncbi:hypothetical protein MAPG_09187 [Magnaporthiopsis poae ATCC 64411]|uniref:Retinol dehydrogenase 13 n=1 Tax=Magnaporthiopsis poae (strain ATCC 64411 / 73-15) TaxID=644358 RepID=A0A0C4E9A8_MAGP6|nr:hypothetical protein MAPG_09187 [Magnaporthiopsis poae ATCC 64411]